MRELSDKAKSLKPGTYKYYYDGGLYRVFGVALHSETLEEIVIYQALDDEGHYWVLPVGMFLEDIEVDGKRVPRFTLHKEKKTS